MFAVLETAVVPRKRWLRRAGACLSVREKPRYIAVTLELPVGAGTRQVRKRAMRCLRQAMRAGAVGVVLPKGFPFPDLPGVLGLAVSSPVPLLRRLAGPLCRFAVEQEGVGWDRVSLSLHAARATPEVVSAAQMLAAYAKTLRIDAGSDTEALCYLLRSRCGVSALTRAAPDGGFWDVRILFDDQALAVAPNALVLRLGGGTSPISGGRVADGALLEPPRSLWRDWPADCDNAAMLTALLASGQVSLSDIGIRGLTCGEAVLRPEIAGF